jgi:hypothetical protein
MEVVFVSIINRNNIAESVGEVRYVITIGVRHEKIQNMRAIVCHVM